MEPLEVTASVHSEVMHRVSVSSSWSSPKKELVSNVKKESAILERARTKNHEIWPKKEWKNKTESHWRPPAGGVVEQNSHDTWRSSKPQGKSKEISAEIDAVGTTVKEKTNTWNKSCRESAKRESELYTMVEQAAIDERQEHKERNMLKDLLQQLQKERRRKRLVG